MTITLSPEQQKWLEAQVAAGRIGSVEEAVRLAVNLIMPLDTTDLSWAKPCLDEARAQLGRGEFVEHGDFKRELAERIKVLRR
jgi:Arc/MetJ-type ribon-helix-helix transcriptional regulator